MMRILLAEWLKTKRTSMRWITFLVPVLFSSLIVWYFSMRGVTDNIQISIFQGFFETWSALVIPVGVGLLSGLMIHQEEMAGSFNGLLGSRTSRSSLFIGKLLMLILLTTLSTMLATVTLVVGLSYVAHIPVSLPVFIAAMVMVVISTLPLLAFHLLISFAWGMGPSIGIGGGGLLLGALMATSLGDTVWQYIPWGWPVRLSMLPGFYLFYLPGMELPPLEISSGFVVHEAIKGIIHATIFFIIMVVGGVLWFNKWEGRKIYD